MNKLISYPFYHCCMLLKENADQEENVSEIGKEIKLQISFIYVQTSFGLTTFSQAT